MSNIQQIASSRPYARQNCSLHSWKTACWSFELDVGLETADGDVIVSMEALLEVNNLQTLVICTLTGFVEDHHASLMTRFAGKPYQRCVHLTYVKQSMHI